jgi:hypothetical protein
MLCCMLISTASSAVYPPPPPADYKIQCLYLYKFSQLVQWPQSNTKEFTIGVVGISSLIPVLEQYIAAKNRISAIKYKVVRFASVEYITDCNLLYVVKDQAGNFDMITKKLNGKPTLLVTELGGLIKRGAGINFIAEEGASLKIQINKAAIESHNLKVLPELLKLATEVM